MNMSSKDMEEMARILSGEASSEERDQFYKVLEADPDKKQAFEMVEREWITAGDALLYKSLDVEAAWERHKNDYLGLPRNERKSSFGLIRKWVAVMVIAAGLVFYFFTIRESPDEQYTSHFTTSYETLPLKLKDGSTITLNQNSTLACQFTKKFRKVNFTGEAFFEVAADPDRPFVIEMEGAYIKVIGTAFNVKVEGPSIDVLVQEGVVEFGLIDRSEMTLIEAGSSGKLYGKQLSKMDTQESNTISWYTKKLVFEQSPLPHVFSDISCTYHVAFQYNSFQLQNCHLTADFNNEELADVLETLHAIFNVEFKKDENIYIVTGKGCE